MRMWFLLGSNQPWESGPENYQRAFSLEGPRRDLALIGLTTPQAILARQLASQQTAFAVAGPAPFKVMIFRYWNTPLRAPFTSISSAMECVRLQRYDERTWQVGVAPLAKNKVLAELSLADLDSIFGKGISSGNQELQSFLDNRLQGHAGNLTFGDRIMPCVFQGPMGRAPGSCAWQRLDQPERPPALFCRGGLENRTFETNTGHREH